MENKNPLNPMDKEAKRIEPELESDDFSPEQQKEIVRMVLDDADHDIETMKEWVEQRRVDIMAYEGYPPSELENLEKESWQSDRNLGLCAAVSDAYQATLLATCLNVDTLYFKAIDSNDTDNKDNLEAFAKWALDNECHFRPEADDFIHNRVNQGTSYFKIYWKVWYEWVDRRMPRKDGGYEIKTEKMRFERGIIENIDNIDDVLIPNYGSHIQELDHIIHVLHLTVRDVIDLGKRNILKNIDDTTINKLKYDYYDKTVSKIGKQKAEALGIKDVSSVSTSEMGNHPIDIYEWYGYYDKNGKDEKFRMRVIPSLQLWVSGKPLREITRTGKYPFVGGAFIRRPGQVRGKSLPRLIAPIVNSINNIYNQKSDFQYVENCPSGFYVPDEGYTKQQQRLVPGVFYPVAGPDPTKSVYIPNLTRSTAWANEDIQFLLEMLERLTGSASYFMSNTQGVSGTATRDNIINEKSETRFGLWVERIIEDLSEAITMLINFYQDNIPTGLAERVLGDDGKQLFPNLSVESLRGNYRGCLVEDVIAGSRTLDKQTKLWAFEALQQSIWLNPQINPKGNWNLTADAMKAQGLTDVERYLPPEPKMALGSSKEVDNMFSRIKKGEVIEPQTTDNIPELYFGMQKKKQDNYHEIDAEYRLNFDTYLFKLFILFQRHVQQAQHEQIATMMASKIIQNKQAGIADEVQPSEQAKPGNNTQQPVRPKL